MLGDFSRSKCVCIARLLFRFCEFGDNFIADISNNCLPIKITKEQVVIKELQINEHNNGDAYCLMRPTTSSESAMHYFDISKIRE